MPSSVFPSRLLALIHESCFNVPAWTQLSCTTKTRIKVGAMAQTIVTVEVREGIPTPLPDPIRIRTMGQDSRPEVQLLHPIGGASFRARIHSFITCSLSTYYVPACSGAGICPCFQWETPHGLKTKRRQGIGRGPGIQSNFDRGNQARPLQGADIWTETWNETRSESKEEHVRHRRNSHKQRPWGEPEHMHSDLKTSVIDDLREVLQLCRSSR